MAASLVAPGLERFMGVARRAGGAGHRTSRRASLYANKVRTVCNDMLTLLVPRSSAICQ